MIKKVIKFIIAVIFYYSGIFLFYKRIIRKGKVTILMFHRVTDNFFDISLIAKKKTFEECMRYIERNYPVISIDYLAHNFDKWEKIPNDSFAITFDDGWLDFYESAYPILAQLKIPATIYLTTGFISSKSEYWQEKINNILIQIFRNREKFSEKDVIISMPELNLKLKNLLLHKVKNEQAVFKFIDSLKEYPHSEILKTISDLEFVLNKHSITIGDRENRPFLNWDELKSMPARSAGGKAAIVSFGSHTMNHVILTRETPDTTKEEISKSREIIEKETGRGVLHFSYPNGNFNSDIKRIVSESYKSACTTKGGFISKDSDIYGLNRIGINEEMITDWKGNFSKYLLIYSIFIESLKQAILYYMPL